MRNKKSLQKAWKDFLNKPDEEIKKERKEEKQQ